MLLNLFKRLLELIRNLNGAPEIADTTQSPWLVFGLSLTAVLVVLGLIRLLGVGWYIIRFHGYQLQRNGNDLRISCGLWTKISASIPIQRIQFISIHRSLLMRWWGLAAIRIETAGGDSSQNENSTDHGSSDKKRENVRVGKRVSCSEAAARIRQGTVEPSNWK